MSRNWRDIEDYEEQLVARRQQDMDPHVLYCFDSFDGRYCYIGVTNNLERRIREHCNDVGRVLYRLLKECTEEEARTYFTVIDTEARGYAKAEARETGLIKAAFFEAFTDHRKPWPLNQRTHDISVEDFREKIEKVAKERDIPREQLERQLITEAERRRLEKKKREEAEGQAEQEAKKRKQAESKAKRAAEEQEQAEREKQEAEEREQEEREKKREEAKQLSRMVTKNLPDTDDSKRGWIPIAGVAFIALLLLIVAAMIFLPRPKPYPTPTTTSPQDTPTPTLTPPPTSLPGMPYIVLYGGSTVRACASRECDPPLGTLSRGARILVYRRDEGECISGNCIWLVFEFAGQEAFLHSSLAEREPSTSTPHAGGG